MKNWYFKTEMECKCTNITHFVVDPALKDSMIKLKRRAVASDACLCACSKSELAGCLVAGVLVPARPMG